MANDQALRTTDQGQRLRTGVVGTGHLGSLHAKMYSEISAAAFVGAFDTDKAKCEAVVSNYSGAKFFSSLDDLLANVDAVSVSTVTSQHFEVAKRALNAGVHVLIEKPITQTVGEADELIGLAEAKGCIIQVGHIERFNPAILALESVRSQADVYRIAPAGAVQPARYRRCCRSRFDDS